MGIDYRRLLLKYIAHVGNEEGITFISKIEAGGVFSEEERQELDQLEDFDECRDFSEALREEGRENYEQACRAYDEERRLALLNAKNTEAE